jgi:hypothetical protein
MIVRESSELEDCIVNPLCFWPSSKYFFLSYAMFRRDFSRNDAPAVLGVIRQRTEKRCNSLRSAKMGCAVREGVRSTERRREKGKKKIEECAVCCLAVQGELVNCLV